MSEGFYLSRVEEPVWYRAPSNFEELCKSCGHPIRPGTVIAETEDDQYIEETCFWCDYEDQTEPI